MPKFKKVRYSDLNARQQEIFNFQWISGALATYGYHTHRVPDDWEGADFIARHMTSGEQIMVQLKGRIHFGKKYKGKGIWIAFRYGDRAFLYPHDELLSAYLKINPMVDNQAWNGPSGAVHSKEPSKAQLALLSEYEMTWIFD